MESVALMLHSHECVWVALAEALPPRSIVHYSAVLAFAVSYKRCRVGPALDARRATECKILVLHSYKRVWHVSVKALSPKTIVY